MFCKIWKIKLHVDSVSIRNFMFTLLLDISFWSHKFNDTIGWPYWIYLFDHLDLIQLGDLVFGLVYILCYCKEWFIWTAIIFFCKICWIIFVWCYLFFPFFANKATFKGIFNFSQSTLFPPTRTKFFTKFMFFITKLTWNVTKSLFILFI